MKMNKRKLAILAVAAMMTAAVFIPVAGSADSVPDKRTEIGFYLDTIITLTAYVDDPQILKDAMTECGKYEQLLSRTVEGSDAWRINHANGEPVEVSEDMAVILRFAKAISEKSGGAFDVTIGPASTLWDFKAETPALPDAEALAEAAKRIDYSKLELDGTTVTLPAGMMIDLGAIAKGYIADQIKSYLKERGVENAILSFGGNVIAIGAKPNGSPWKVGIQDIDGEAQTAMLVSKNIDMSAVTSGIYERGFEMDGVIYHHLLSPFTGWPVQNELASVTIFSDSSMMGDALSTTAFVMGTEAGMELIESLEGVEAVFIDRERNVTYSSGAEAYIIQ
ncbi:MAG: FAD:protein FMN transferase [Clostridia bacterium]|nr:FAD:protein FMN transferase [Clostridia bacterium]